jgi:hypothetical protein
MMFETSYFHDDLFAMHEIFKPAGLEKFPTPKASTTTTWSSRSIRTKAGESGFRRSGIRRIPMRITSASAAKLHEVSCQGIPSVIEHLKPSNNVYKNPFGTEIALFPHK